MTADAAQFAPGWFEYKPGGDIVHGTLPDRIGAGYERTLDYARDLVARPHERAASDLLWAECVDVAEKLVTVSDEDGDARFLAACLRTMLIDTVRRIGVTS